MKYDLLRKKIELLNKTYITKEELKKYLKPLNLEYNKTINNLVTNKFLLRIFRGVFYVVPKEKRVKNIYKIKHKTKNGFCDTSSSIIIKDLNFNDIITNALKIKNINNWYFGLDTAIKLNHLTHETKNIIYIINDKIFRPNEIKIINKNVKFIKLKKKLFSFGIIKKDINYSDTEKTVLDIIYLLKYNNETNKTILNSVVDLLDSCNKKKLKEYSKYYPKTTYNVIKEYVDG